MAWFADGSFINKSVVLMLGDGPLRDRMLEAHHTFGIPCLWNVDSDRELIGLDHQPNTRHAVFDADRNDPKHLLPGRFPTGREGKTRLVRDFPPYGGAP